MAYSFHTGYSAPDPFSFNENPLGAAGAPIYAARGYNVLGSLQPTPAPSPASTKCIGLGGQSNMASSCGTSVFSTAQGGALMLNPYDGGVYHATEPVLGASNTTGSTGVNSISARIADSMITRGKCTNCIVGNISIGGTTFLFWEPPGGPGGVIATYSLCSRIETMIRRFRARGLELDAFFWGQGETDKDGGTPSASITASIWSIVDKLRAAPLSWANPFYVGLYTTTSNTSGATTRTGIINSVDAGRNIKLGYDADTNITSGMRLDGTHFNDTGLATAATGWTTLAFP